MGRCDKEVMLPGFGLEHEEKRWCQVGVYIQTGCSHVFTETENIEGESDL